jgi:hypothetical protein
VEAVGVEVAHLSGAEPHFVVHTFGYRAIRYNWQRLRAAVHPGFGVDDRAELAGFDEGNRVLEVFLAALPLVDLYHFARGFGGADHCFGFADGVGYGFFHVHVFARRKGIGELQAMPMIGGSHNDRVKVFVFKHLAVVFVFQQVADSGFAQVFFTFGQLGIVDVTNGHEVNFVDFQEGPNVAEALVSEPDEAYVDFIAWCHGFAHGNDGFQR